MWESVKRILRAYAAHDSATGYVQSMNFMTAFLLLAGVSEEDAFWCLVALVSRVVPDAQLMDETRAIAGKIAANPPHAVRMTKRLLREGYRASLANILEMSAAMQAATQSR